MRLTCAKESQILFLEGSQANEHEWRDTSRDKLYKMLILGETCLN